MGCSGRLRPGGSRDEKAVPPRLDLIGQRFGRLLVLAHAGLDSGGRSRWRCLCDCGGLAVVTGNSLRTAHTRSCGCLATDRRRRHGRSESSTYESWHQMKSRCQNPKNKNYRNYGGRGIGVCDRWLLFENFLADMGERPDGLTLERKHNDLGYEPGNCTWATAKEQANNRRADGRFPSRRR